MSQINHFAGSVLQATQVQKQQETEKNRQVRRANALLKNIAVEDDRLEYQVESPEEIKPIREESREGHEPPHVDLTA